MVRAFVTADKIHEQWEISSNLRLDMVRALRAAGIPVATPTRVLKVVSETPVDVQSIVDKK
jgi:small-conductance mechanosensitive channel